MEAPRQLTKEEVKERFLNHIWKMIEYWATLDKGPVDALKTFEDRRDRLEGLAFSILGMLDGVSMDLPGFQVLSNPHEDDRQDAKDNGENWFPYHHPAIEDIAGALHEEFYTIIEGKEKTSSK